MNDQNDTIIYQTPLVIDTAKRIADGTLATDIARFKELPAALQVIMRAFETAEFIYDVIGERYKLTPIQKDNLTRIVRDIMMADVFLGDLTDNIQSRLEVDEKMAGDIANSLLEQIFVHVWTELKQIHMEKFGNRAQNSSPEIKPETQQQSNNSPRPPAPPVTPTDSIAMPKPQSQPPMATTTNAHYYPVRNGIIRLASLRGGNRLRAFPMSNNRPTRSIQTEHHNQDDTPGLTVNLRKKK